MQFKAQEKSDSDEIRREDGLERYFLFYNGEWAKTICGLTAGMGGVFWCFLYVLGFRQTILAYVLGGIVLLGLVGLRFINSRLSDYAEHDWKPDGRNTPGDEKKKLYIALGLWIFILVFFGGLVLFQRISQR